MSPTAQVDVVVLQHLLNFWDSRNIDIAPIWQVLGIDPAQPLPRWIAASRLSDVHQLLSAAGHDLTLPALAGQYLSQQELPVGRLLSCAESLAQGVPVCLRFAYLTAGSVHFVVSVGEATVRIAVEEADADTATEQQLLGLSCIAYSCQRALQTTRRDGDLRVVVPQSVVVTDALAEIIDLPISIGEGFALEIRNDAWQRPNPRQKNILFSNVLREFEREDQKFREYVAIYNELKHILHECLLQRHISQEDVASRLGISVRNLQRRLKALGTNYQRLLDECRQTLAMQLIEDMTIPLYEVSYMVGYTEPSAFYKAFKRWAGTTPGEYRQALQPGFSHTELSPVSREPSAASDEV